MNPKGFTLIELIMVVVILGVLAAVAIPRFVDMQGDAKKAAAEGVFSSAQLTCAENFSRNLINSTTDYITNGAELLAKLEGATGWTASGNTITDGNGNTITVSSPETAGDKAKLTNNW